MRGRCAGLQLGAQLAEQAVAFGEDVVLVDRLEVLLASGDEAPAVELRERAQRRRRASPARSPRRSAVGGGPFRRPRPRRSASSARRSPRTCSPRRSRAGPWRRSPRRSPPPARSAAWPAHAGCGWRPARSPGSARSGPRRSPAASRRSRARAATSSWAQGQAVMPVAETPTVRRVPWAKATARPWRV